MVKLTYCISKKTHKEVIYLKKLVIIDKHFLEEISIPEIAAYVDINKSSSALFTDKIGCTIQSLYKPEKGGAGNISALQ